MGAATRNAMWLLPDHLHTPINIQWVHQRHDKNSLNCTLPPTTRYILATLDNKPSSMRDSSNSHQRQAAGSDACGHSSATITAVKPWVVTVTNIMHAACQAIWHLA